MLIDFDKDHFWGPLAMQFFGGTNLDWNHWMSVVVTSVMNCWHHEIVLKIASKQSSKAGSMSFMNIFWHPKPPIQTVYLSRGAKIMIANLIIQKSYCI
jgi:hypothetical protein